MDTENIRTSAAPRADWALRPAAASDVEPIAELRAVVMRPDLERLGRFDEHRVRQRFRDAFSARYTSVIEVADAHDDHDAHDDRDEYDRRRLAGCITVRPEGGGLLLEHFYLAPRQQGRGLGSAVLREVLRRADAERATVRLIVLQGSAARRLYERHGFAVTGQDAVDVFMTRPGAAPA